MKVNDLKEFIQEKTEETAMLIAFFVVLYVCSLFASEYFLLVYTSLYSSFFVIWILGIYDFFLKNKDK